MTRIIDENSKLLKDTRDHLSRTPPQTKHNRLENRLRRISIFFSIIYIAQYLFTLLQLYSLYL